MMKVSGRILISCRINFGRSVPTRSLVLLHWFANTVTIDGYNMISLNFDPDNGDYGSHHYSNYEGLLPRGNTRYYTIGNIYQERGLELPHHVVYPRPEYVGRNRARIIVRIRNQRRQGLQIIDEVYITQHYEDNRGPDYDPHHTYLITTNLLRQIRQFSMNGDQSANSMSTLFKQKKHTYSNTDELCLQEIISISCDMD
uniref:Uncharacterized protein n=1 Tax=Amphiprion percula TaxID=161767 RepID=A0A3P8SKI4_AMPPE